MNGKRLVVAGAALAAAVALCLPAPSASGWRIAFSYPASEPFVAE